MGDKIYWVLGIVVLMIILILVALRYQDVFVDESSFGRFTTPSYSQCHGSTCGAEGTQTVTVYCIPNPETRKGCLLPDGTQTFLPRVFESKCNVICPSYRWVTLEEQPCFAYGAQGFNNINPFSNPSIPCADPGSIVVSLTKRECVPGSWSEGPNLCVDVRGETHTAGYIEEFTTPCKLTDVNQCGEFNTCSSDLSFSYGLNVNTVLPEPFNLLHEGTSVNPLTCTYTAIGGKTLRITPLPTDQPAVFCNTQIPGCRSLPTPQNVVDKDIPDPVNQIVCRNPNNPSCLELARKYPLSATGFSVLNPHVSQFVQRPLQLFKGNSRIGVSTSLFSGLTRDLVPGGTPVTFWWSPSNNVSTGPMMGRIFIVLDSEPLWLSVQSGKYVANSAMIAYLTGDMNVDPRCTVEKATIMTLTIVSTNPTPPPPAEKSFTVNITSSTSDPNFQNATMLVFPLMQDFPLG